MYIPTKDKFKRNSSSFFKITNDDDGPPNELVELVPSDAEGDDLNYDTNPFKMQINARTNGDYRNMNLFSSGNASNNAEFKDILEIENNMEYKNNRDEDQNQPKDDYQDERQQNDTEENRPNFGKSAKIYLNDENENYKELLEQKVRKQAKRLCVLQEYKSLCEKRIRQLNPGHPMPIVESHVSNSSVSSQVQEIQMNNTLKSNKFKIQELMNKLVSKEGEIN